MIRCVLVAAKVKDSNMQGCDLEYADFEHSKFERVNLKDSDLNSTDLMRCDWSEVDCTGATLLSVDTFGAWFRGVTFVDASATANHTLNLRDAHAPETQSDPLLLYAAYISRFFA